MPFASTMTWMFRCIRQTNYVPERPSHPPIGFCVTGGFVFSWRYRSMCMCVGEFTTMPSSYPYDRSVVNVSCWPLHELPLRYPFILVTSQQLIWRICARFPFVKSFHLETENHFSVMWNTFILNDKDHVIEWIFVVWIWPATGTIWIQYFAGLIELKYN